MKIFNPPFTVANEAVKRNKLDNRRLKKRPERGGNNIFYLGTTSELYKKFTDKNLLKKLSEIENEFQNNPQRGALKVGEGIRAHHRVKMELLQCLLPFLNSFLLQNKQLYHNPNINISNISKRLSNIDKPFLTFESEVVFIPDKRIRPRPYFKWFNKYPTASNFQLFREFLIPELSFLNFDYLKFENHTLFFDWELTYAPVVMTSTNNIEDIILNAIQSTFPKAPPEEVETLREAVAKIRIGQTKFRDELLASDQNSCIFTNLSDPQLLIASHIKAWKDSNNSERLNIHNGILLSPTFDKLFDRHLITFNDNGTLRWSTKRLSVETIDKLKSSITVNTEVQIEVTEGNKTFLKYHRAKFFELENDYN